MTETEKQELKALAERWCRSLRSLGPELPIVPLAQGVLTLLTAARWDEWKPIETAPKDIVSRHEMTSGGKFHEYGPYLLLWPVDGEVARGRWWQAVTYRNWLTDSGLAVQPTHWKYLPDPPAVQQP